MRLAAIKRRAQWSLLVLMGLSVNVPSQPVTVEPSKPLNEAEVPVIPPAYRATRFPWRTTWAGRCARGGPTKHPGCLDYWPVQIYIEDQAIDVQILDNGHETGQGFQIAYDDIKDIERRGLELVAITHIDGQVEYFYVSRPGNHKLGHSAESKQLVDEIRRRIPSRAVPKDLLFIFSAAGNYS